MPTPETKLTFGKYRGLPLKAAPLDYLRWMSEKLHDGEFTSGRWRRKSFSTSRGTAASAVRSWRRMQMRSCGRTASILITLILIIE